MEDLLPHWTWGPGQPIFTPTPSPGDAEQGWEQGPVSPIPSETLHSATIISFQGRKQHSCRVLSSCVQLVLSKQVEPRAQARDVTQPCRQLTTQTWGGVVLPTSRGINQTPFTIAQVLPRQLGGFFTRSGPNVKPWLQLGEEPRPFSTHKVEGTTGQSLGLF